MIITVRAIVGALLPELFKGSLALHMGDKKESSYMYNCIRANVRWSGGKCSTQNQKSLTQLSRIKERMKAIF